ncbi:MAG: hypothetical protein WCG25_01005 [bacterium]
MFSNVFKFVQINSGYLSGSKDICIYLDCNHEENTQSQNSGLGLFTYLFVKIQSRLSSFTRFASLALKANSIHSFARNVAIFLVLVSSNLSRLFVTR